MQLYSVVMIACCSVRGLASRSQTRWTGQSLWTGFAIQLHMHLPQRPNRDRLSGVSPGVLQHCHVSDVIQG